MVAIKPQQAQAFLKALDKRVVAVLVYGPDAGLVAERAREAAERMAQRDNPPGEILRIEDPDLESDPDRIHIELQTMAMFGSARIVRTTASRRVTAPLLKSLLEPGAIAGGLVVEAGNLRPDEVMRKLFEGPAHAAAIPCFADESRDVDGVVSEALSGFGLTIGSEARQMLVARLGADRALTRAELEKLALYVHGRTAITAEDVEAVVGDASGLAIDSIVFAASAGDRVRAVKDLDRALASGESPQAIIAAVQRHFQRLHRLRSALDAGQSFDSAARSLRPPLMFKSRPIIEAHTRSWDAPKLNRAVALIATAAKRARLAGDLEAAVAERLLLELAGLVSRGR
ncbi:MAG: DNA polymerase III subunit delta [Hyphomicrobiaceae bacterium]